MDENKELVPETSGADENTGEKKNSLFRRVAARFDGMSHIFIAFLFPVLVMALIYIAMDVWPFGDNSVLVLDLNGQYVYYFEALRDILRGEQGILYSFERALGGEFLGIVAYYLASPFSVLVALFPEGMITESLYTILLLKCGLSGMNMCIYLHKSHPTKPTNEVIFSVLYALTSYGVVMQHNTMWFDCVLFFPLIMLGIESLVRYGKYKLFVLTLAVSVFSNYYIGYMVCIAVAVYFFFYYFKSTEEERNPMGESRHFLKAFGRIALFSAIAVGMAAIMILPAYYSLSFGKSTFSDPSYNFEQKFDFLDLVAKMLPCSYDTVRPEGLPFVYSGVLTLVLLPLFFFIKKITARKKIAYGALALFFILSFNASTVDIAWHGFQSPNWLNYRYSFMFCFVIIVMAYKVFEHIEDIDFRYVLASGGALCVTVMILQKLEYENLPDLLSIWFSIGFIGAYMILLGGCNKRWLDGTVSSVLCIFVLLELFSNGLANIISLDDDVHYSSRKSYIEFVEKWSGAADWMNENDKSFYRAEKTGHRKTNDNFTLNIRGLSNSTSTLNSNQIDFLQRMGYSSKSHWSKYLGGTPVSDSLLGLKYIMCESEEEMSALYGDAVFVDEENGISVYKNPYALSLGYTVSSDIAQMEFGEIDSPFERMNKMVTAMLGEDEEIELFKPYKNIRPTLDNLTLSVVSGCRRYDKINKSVTGKLTFSLTPVNDSEIFIYFPTDYKRGVDLKLNGGEWGEYFTNETYRIVSLGHQTAGEEFTLSMTLQEDRVYMKNNVDYFYYLDEEVFKEIMPRLAEGGYDIESFTDDRFIGTVTASEDAPYMLLTIPHDEGWKIYVDGELCESFEVLDCLTAIELTPGEHTVEMKYSPWCVKYGALISAVSLLAFSTACLVEQLIKRKREKIAA